MAGVTESTVEDAALVWLEEDGFRKLTRPDIAASRAYYAMFYAAQALFLQRGLSA